MKLSLFTRTRTRFISSLFAGFLGSLIFYIISSTVSYIPVITKTPKFDYRRRPECRCSRPALPPLSSHLLLNEQHPSFCSHYTSQRGPHQHIISISLFRSKDVQKFEINQLLQYLLVLIQDFNKIYSDGFILRIYHDDIINVTDVICPIECKYSNIDFCHMDHKIFIPPKIWRFIPAGDPLVDISKFKILIKEVKSF
jgi:hypothetical protein